MTTGAMDNIGRALLTLSKVRGDSGTYYHRNDSGQTIYFVWGNASTAPDEIANVLNDVEGANVTIPKQSCLSGLEPSPGDVLVDASSKAWRVDNVSKLGLATNPCAWRLMLSREAELNRTDG